jgi:hypothetical protein
VVLVIFASFFNGIFSGGTKGFFELPDQAFQGGVVIYQ